MASLGAKILEVMADLNMEVVICSYKKFWSRIEAVIGASGDLIKQLCMQYPSTLLLKFSVRYVHPNYLFYCFKCVRRVCPNLSSVPCTVEELSCFELAFVFLNLKLKRNLI